MKQLIGDKVDRRRFLKGSAMAATGIAAVGLVGCGDDDGGSETASSPGPSGSPPSSGSRQGGTLTFSLGGVAVGDPDSLDPIVTGFTPNSMNFLHGVFDSLWDFDENLNLRPGLAESFELVDDTTVIFQLRQGIEFHDGTPFNAEAVRQHILRAQDASTNSNVVSLLSPIERVEAPTADRVQLTLNRAFSPLLYILADKAGMIGSPAAVEQAGEGFGQRPVGTGAFKFVEWVPSDHITLERNPRYWQQGQPYLDRIIYRNIPDSGQQINLLLGGELQLVFGTPAIPGARVPELSANSDFVLQTKQATQFNTWFFNYQRPPFNDPDVREAMNWAIDREELVEGVLFGQGGVIQGPIPAFHPFFNESLRGFEPKADLEKARAALSRAGLADGFSFVGVSGNGQQDTQRLVLLQEQLNRIGVELKIQQLDVTGAYRQALSGDFDAYIQQWSGRVALWETFSAIWQSTGGYNFGKIADAELDGLIARASETYEEDEQRELFQQAEQRIVDLRLNVFDYFTAFTSVARKEVTNFRLWGEGKSRFNEVSLA
ncbi:MAG TPA: ABC transporter substrate-binding protein [Gemmatimonadales bacterium]|nr:ABC transporter substrate-binding protein [Gemmatimonadales bacterium]